MLEFDDKCSKIVEEVRNVYAAFKYEGDAKILGRHLPSFFLLPPLPLALCYPQSILYHLTLSGVHRRVHSGTAGMLASCPVAKQQCEG